MRHKRASSITSTEDDVRSCLDLLDSVIGEFDVESKTKSTKETIDDIFSELTNEYGKEKENGTSFKKQQTFVKAQIHSFENQSNKSKTQNDKITHFRKDDKFDIKSNFKMEERRSRSMGPLEVERKMSFKEQKSLYVPPPSSKQRKSRLTKKEEEIRKRSVTVDSSKKTSPQSVPSIDKIHSMHFPSGRLLHFQGRQKSMIDLRSSPPIESRNRRSMAVDPFENYISGQRAKKPSSPLFYRRKEFHSSQNFDRHTNLEAQKDFLVKHGGFSTSHPFISGEISIHPELMGRLPFHVPSRTIPLRPEDYKRFHPERWLNFQGDPELRRRREIHRKNSQNVRQQHFGHHWLLREKLDDDPRSINSTLRDSGIEADGGMSPCHRGSFGMILKDRFQNNPNMYFPVMGPQFYNIKNFSGEPEDNDEVVSDTDTLINDNSEGSFDKEDESLSPYNSMEGSPRMISKPTQSQPNITSSNERKKTIRNYNPKESSTMLKKLEDVRLSDRSSVEKMIDEFHRNLPSANTTTNTTTTTSLASSKNENLDSEVWSVASSCASFDFQRGENTCDDFLQLRKLIAEGKISGLNASPPTFIPPPPTRKTREAPPPPKTSKLHSSNDNLTREPNKISRCESNRLVRNNLDKNQKDTMAQLIADSTERKFNFNPFKGMWKKKHYSFDFN